MQKITRATSRSYRRLYGPTEKAFRRSIFRFINKNEKKILNKFWSLYRSKIKKTDFGIISIEKASIEVQFETAVTDGMSGDFALDPVVVQFVGDAAEAVLDILKEELTLFDNGIVTQNWMRNHGLDLAKNLSDSLSSTLKKELARGMALNESPAILKERLRKHLGDYKEFQLERLARTEAMQALNEGALESFRQSRVINGKMWIAHAGACVICEGLNGIRRYLEQTFPGGYQRPPEPHPNCRCSLGGVRLPKRSKK